MEDNLFWTVPLSSQRSANTLCCGNPSLNRLLLRPSPPWRRSREPLHRSALTLGSHTPLAGNLFLKSSSLSLSRKCFSGALLKWACVSISVRHSSRRARKSFRPGSRVWPGRAAPRRAVAFLCSVLFSLAVTRVQGCYLCVKLLEIFFF